jgi:hypothetical protein
VWWVLPSGSFLEVFAVVDFLHSMRSLSLLNVSGVTFCGWLHTTVVDNFSCRLVTFSSDNICTRWERTIASGTFLRMCRFTVDWSSVSCRAVLLVFFIIDNIFLLNIGFINRFIYIIYSFLIQKLIFFILQFLVHLRNNIPEIIRFIWILIHLGSANFIRRTHHGLTTICLYLLIDWRFVCQVKRGV